jgi:signal peptidase I
MQRVRPPAWLLGRRPSRTLLRALVLALLTYGAGRHLARPVRVRGTSMEPTLADRSLHLASLVRYRRIPPARGDVVIIAMAGGRAFYLKRVLGLPGERVQLEAGRLFINGAEQPEPYLPEGGAWSMPERPLGPDEFFVAGDNRRMPLEDHAAGVVHRERIAGGLLF